MNTRLLMLIGGGILVAGVVWYSFLRNDTAQPLLTTEDTTAKGVQADVVTTLLQLRAISLSGTIFSDPVFSSLQDFGSTIVPEPVGRPNPFAPLGSSAKATSTSSQSRR